MVPLNTIQPIDNRCNNPCIQPKAFKRNEAVEEAAAIVNKALEKSQSKEQKDEQAFFDMLYQLQWETKKAAQAAPSSDANKPEKKHVVKK